MKDWTEAYISPRPRSWSVGAGDCPPRGVAQMDGNYRASPSARPRDTKRSTLCHPGVRESPGTGGQGRGPTPGEGLQVPCLGEVIRGKMLREGEDSAPPG